MRIRGSKRQSSFGAATVVVALSLLSLGGCTTPDRLGSESVGSQGQTIVIPRMHQEIIDPEDGLFITYWERDDDGDGVYTVGDAFMETAPGAYWTYVDNVNVTEIDRPNFVVGKGRNPCFGEIMHFDAELTVVETTPGLSATHLGVYGWMEEPLVEYYIGKSGGEPVGEYVTSKGTYRLNVEFAERENILNPTATEDLPLKFLQFNAQSLDGVPSEEGPVDLAQHFAGWEKLMETWWPNQTTRIQEGFNWFPLAVSNYCVVATEVWGKTSAVSVVNDISFEEQISLNPIAHGAPPEGTATDDPLVYRVTATEPWTINPSTIPDWLTVSPTSGAAGVTIVKVTVTPNPMTNNERGANLELEGSSGSGAILQVFQFYEGEGAIPTGGGGSASSFQIIRDGNWTASTSAPWLSVTPSSGTNGTYDLYVSTTPNTTGASRTGTVTVTGGGQTKTFQVSQAALFLYNDPMSLSLASGGETRSVEVYSNAVWWSAYTTDGGDWLSIGGGSGSGHGTISLTATPNYTGATRKGTITLQGGDVTTRVIPVSQEPTSPPACDPSNVLVNPSFESGTSGWTAWGGSLGTTNFPVRTGGLSGMVTNRTESWQGPVQDLLGKVTAGHTYAAEGWATVLGIWSQPLALTLKSECSGSPATYTQLGTATGNGWSWTKLSGQFTVPTCSLASLALYIEGPAPGITLYADDVSVKEVCP